MLSGGVLNIDRLHALSQIMQVEGDKCIEHGEAFQQDDCKKLGMELKRVAVQVYLVFQQRTASETRRAAYATEFEALNTLVAMESVAPGSSVMVADYPPPFVRPHRQTPRVICDYSRPEPGRGGSLSTGSASCEDVRSFYACPNGGKQRQGIAMGTCASALCDCGMLRNEEEEKTHNALQNSAMYESDAGICLSPDKDQCSCTETGK